MRSRCYGLLQELRVVLPGDQVLLAFLTTVPFAPGFGDLDDLGRDLYGVAMVSTALAVALLMTPIALHRFGVRSQRRLRLLASIATTRLGLGLLPVAVVLTVTVVSRFVFGAGAGIGAGIAVGMTFVITWVVLPMALRDRDRHERSTRTRAHPSG